MSAADSTLQSQRFVHRFRNGVLCTMTIYTNGQIRCSWSHEITSRKVRRVFREYQQWRNASIEAFCREFNLGRCLVIDL